MVIPCRFVKSFRRTLCLLLLSIMASSAYAALEPEQQRKINNDLVYQAFFGSAEEIQQLITAGANPNAANEKGVPALSLAAQRKNPEGLAVVKALLASGADKDGRDMNGQTPLFHAARMGNLPTVKLLLEMGVDYYLTDNKGEIARNLAYLQGHTEVFEAMDKFVNEQREAVLQAYRDKNQHIRDRNAEILARREAAKQTATEKNAVAKPAKEIERVHPQEVIVEANEEEQAILKQGVQDLFFHSCVYQYWYYITSVDLKAAIAASEIPAVMDTHKKAADTASTLLVDNFGVNKKYVSSVLKASQSEISRTLAQMGSNITRKSNGVGATADGEKRCNEITSRWMLLNEPPAPRMTKTVPMEEPNGHSDTPESSADPATELLSDPADEEDRMDDKSPPQESL